MQYKTIILHLLEQHPRLQEQLRSQRLLLPMLESYSFALKANHEVWKNRLSQAKPDSDQSQIASAALEMALKELEDSLPSASLPDDESPSLDEAMAFILHTPPG